MSKFLHPLRQLDSSQIITLGFLTVILFGAVILSLPICSADFTFTPFVDSLFTATSAVCITGLTVVSTAYHWNILGKLMILMLIQIGGIGFMSMVTMLFIAVGKKITLKERIVIQESFNLSQRHGLVSFTIYIFKFSFVVELIGAFFLSLRFIPQYGFVRGIFYGIFHSVSAFCNAGFDILGTSANPFPSLTGYSANVLVNVVIMLLIIIGGIGFLTWDDIYTNKLKFKRYRMQSKIILVTTACLILIPIIFFFICDLKNLSAGNRLLAAAFQSVTTRTAGFNTIDISKMSEASKAVMILLMLIGGSPGSTAGGMKTTTFTVLLLNAIATFRSQENAGAFGRRLEYHVIKNAATIAMLYFTLFFCGGLAISVYEELPLLDCLYEAASAVGTVGLTLGITPKLHMFSQIVLIILMYLGRVGGLTLIYAVLSRRNRGNAKLPLEKITVG